MVLYSAVGVIIFEAELSPSDPHDPGARLTFGDKSRSI